MRKLVRYLKEENTCVLPNWYAWWLAISSIWASMKLIKLVVIGLFKLIDGIPSKEEREKKKLERAYATINETTE